MNNHTTQFPNFRKTINILIVFIVLFLFTPVNAYSFFFMGNGYFNGNKGKGWFWYQQKPKKNKNKNKIKKTLKLPTTKTLMAMPARQFKKLLKKFKYESISYPTEQNVYNYIKIQYLYYYRFCQFLY